MCFLEQFRAGLARLGVPASGIVVAVSGGADSVALLQALIRLRAREDEGPIIVAHLNHGLRGAESDADADFVRKLFTRLQSDAGETLLFCTKNIDVNALAAAEGGNLESVARRERYAWLASMAERFGVPRVATGHTADDQAETVLHRLLRGTGLQGLRGIAPRRELAPGVELIRPMLAISRPAIIAFLQEIGQPYREDRSNADLSFTRNRIRHELLPLLEKTYNAAVRTALAQLAEQSAEVFRDIEASALALLDECELPRAGDRVILDRIKLEIVPRHLVRELLRLLWRREAWPRDGMSFDDWDRAAGVVLGEQNAVDLPGRITIGGHGRVVQVGRGTNAQIETC